MSISSFCIYVSVKYTIVCGKVAWRLWQCLLYAYCGLKPGPVCCMLIACWGPAVSDVCLVHVGASDLCGGVHIDYFGFWVLVVCVWVGG